MTTYVTCYIEGDEPVALEFTGGKKDATEGIVSAIVTSRAFVDAHIRTVSHFFEDTVDGDEDGFLSRELYPESFRGYAGTIPKFAVNFPHMADEISVVADLMQAFHDGTGETDAMKQHFLRINQQRTCAMIMIANYLDFTALFEWLMSTWIYLMERAARASESLCWAMGIVAPSTGLSLAQIETEMGFYRPE